MNEKLAIVLSQNRIKLVLHAIILLKSIPDIFYESDRSTLLRSNKVSSFPYGLRSEIHRSDLQKDFRLKNSFEEKTNCKCTANATACQSPDSFQSFGEIENTRTK